MLFDIQLKRKNTLVGNAKAVEEFNPERLGFRIFIGSVGPASAEIQHAGFDFVPG
nr:hypothetical protein [Ottowia massiliensis]